MVILEIKNIILKPYTELMYSLMTLMYNYDTPRKVQVHSIHAIVSLTIIFWKIKCKLKQKLFMTGLFFGCLQANSGNLRNLFMSV